MISLRLLPFVTEPAAAAMARDSVLLDTALRPDELLFRHYAWAEPAFTFGISQPHATARALTPPHCALVRRPTGGGLVSHLDDWTYALLAPAGHPLAELKAAESYRLVHEAIAAALADCATAAALVPCPRAACPAPGTGAPAPVAPARKPGVCAREPEIFDVVRPADGRKIAGAAQKRTRAGILFQGYIEKSLCPDADWRRFATAFPARLAAALGATLVPGAPDPCAPADLARETARFASADWNLRR